MEDLKILLVDDDDDLRTSIELFLKNKRYNVTSAINGVKAFELFMNNNYDLIISDIKMPHMDGTALLNSIKNRKPETFFILMTGFAEILATIDAFQLGANGFLAKPFKLNELEEMIIKFINSQTKDSGENEQENKIEDILDAESKYNPIDIDKFIHGSSINYSIYIKLSENKFVKIGHKGEDVSEESIAKFKNKKISHLYLLTADYKQYIQMTKNLAHAISENVIKISKKKKLQFITNASQIIMKDVFSDAIHKSNFEGAHVIMKKTLEIASDNNSLFQVCDSILSHSNKLYAHSLFVSMFSVMLARELKWDSPKNIELITMGALFHDIGKRGLSPNLVNKKLIELDFEERKKIELHTTMGAEMLMELPNTPEVIIQITLQHHENCVGTGYPSGLNANNIHPLAKIVSLANEFAIAVDSIDENISTTERYYKALKKIKTIKKNYFDKEYFLKFMKLFKSDIEEEEVV